MKRNPYLQPGRLEEVILLLQILALSAKPDGMYQQTIEKLLSGRSDEKGAHWFNVASEHPEFFRVAGEKEMKEIRLIARFAAREVTTDPLTFEPLQRLISTAIELHDRQARAAERRKVYVPLMVAIISGVIGIVRVVVEQFMR